jgi:hypothetical protein
MRARGVSLPSMMEALGLTPQHCKQKNGNAARHSGTPVILATQ